MKNFNYAAGLTMTKNGKWKQLFGLDARKEDEEITQPYMDLALAIQQILDEIVLLLAKTSRQLTGSPNLVMAGGVALNCVSNGKLFESQLFQKIWIQPAAGDAGGALGAALAAHYLYFGQPRKIGAGDSMKGAFLGPEYSDHDVQKIVKKFNIEHTRFDNYDELAELAAKFIADGGVVGWFQGRMEYGPRALGNRSILGDARNEDMQKKMNLKIKFRESFRPFAPAVLEEDILKFFEYNLSSPYMLFVVPVIRSRCIEFSKDMGETDLYTRLYFKRSDVPAITHIDFSARLETVSRTSNERFWKVINEFKKLTGYGIIINTSFNVRGEPIVCTPEDAFRCFMNTEIDYLFINNYLFRKTELSHLKEVFSRNYSFGSD